MKAIITSLLISVLALPAFAKPEDQADAAKDAKQARKAPNPEAVFKKKDSNSDGFLSKDEFVAKMKDAERAATMFQKKDKDGDGKLSLEEFKPAPKKDAPKGGAKKQHKAPDAGAAKKDPAKEDPAKEDAGNKDK